MVEICLSNSGSVIVSDDKYREITEEEGVKVVDETGKGIKAIILNKEGAFLVIAMDENFKIIPIAVEYLGIKTAMPSMPLKWQ